MLAHCFSRWPNMKTKLAQFMVFAGIVAKISIPQSESQRNHSVDNYVILVIALLLFAVSFGEMQPLICKQHTAVERKAGINLDKIALCAGSGLPRGRRGWLSGVCACAAELIMINVATAGHSTITQVWQIDCLFTLSKCQQTSPLD